MARLSTGTPAKPRSSHSGLANAPEPANSNAMSRECLGFCWRTDECAGSHSSTNIWGSWYLRLPHQPWKSGKGSRKPLAPVMLLPSKVFLQHEIDIHLRTRLFSALVVSILLCISEIWVPTHACRCDEYTFFYLRCLRRMGRLHRAPVPGKERLADAEVLKKMQMPSVSLSSRHAVLARQRQRQCAVVRWTLCSASCLPMMRAPISCHLSCYVTYVSLLSANLEKKPILETPFDDWPAWVSDMVLRRGKWKTMLASARTDG